jgi:hypothetical protein
MNRLIALLTTLAVTSTAQAQEAPAIPPQAPIKPPIVMTVPSPAPRSSDDETLPPPPVPSTPPTVHVVPGGIPGAPRPELQKPKPCVCTTWAARRAEWDTRKAEFNRRAEEINRRLKKAKTMSDKQSQANEISAISKAVDELETMSRKGNSASRVLLDEIEAHNEKFGKGVRHSVLAPVSQSVPATTKSAPKDGEHT